jgi:hypothetical protein
MRRTRRIATASGASIGAALAISPAAQAADFTVTNNLDAGAGSLRQAVLDAQVAANPDRILFAPSVTGAITLTTGDLYIDTPIEIVGPGADALTISGNNTSRIFEIQQDLGQNVTISGLHLNDGNSLPDDGGAILVDAPGRVVLSEMQITSSEGDGGGGISAHGSVRVENSTISGNEADGGGGVAAYGGLLRFSSSTVSGNHANDGGGGIAAVYGVMTIENSTISGNTVDPLGNPGIGGGLFLYLETVVTLESATVSGNSAGVGGGGISSFYNLEDPVMHNTIVAGNTATAQPDVSGLPSPNPAAFGASYSLIGSTAGSTINETVPGSNILNQGAALAPLGANGGVSQTQAITESSPAFDAGDPGDFPETDQRGVPRPQFTAPDIGAFELEDTVAPTAKLKPKPKKKLKTGKSKVEVALEFKSDEAGATFECKLKGGKQSLKEYAPCQSPTSYKLESKGGKGKKYTFQVRATDLSGNVGDPAKGKFSVIRK